MKVCEHELTTSNVLPFELDWLFHLHDHLAIAPHGCGVRRDLGTDPGEHFVRESTAHAGSVLDQHTVTGGDELLRSRGHERDAVFVRFDFLRNADFHGRNRSWCVGADAEHRKLTTIAVLFNGASDKRRGTEAQHRLLVRREKLTPDALDVIRSDRVDKRERFVQRPIWLAVELDGRRAV